MNDEEYIDHCYRKLLRRPADAKGKQTYLDALGHQGMTREQLVAALVNCREFETIIGNLEHFPPGHYASAISSKEERTAFVNRCDSLPTPRDVDLHDDAQWNLSNKFFPYYQELPFPVNKQPPLLYHYENPAFRYADGIWLHCMIREFKPKRIIEAGSGFSSCLMIDTSLLFFNSQLELTFIEPYPELLNELLAKSQHEATVIAKRIQDTPLEAFAKLQANDILFIDSSHVSKLGSDLNFILFEILPILKTGVIIHFHDIFWPFEYPKEWVAEGRCWNEIYLLHAFLANNDAYSILLFPDYLQNRSPKWFDERMPLSQKSRSGSLWLRKEKG